MPTTAASPSSMKRLSFSSGCILIVRIGWFLSKGFGPARLGRGRVKLRSLGVGAEHLHQHPHREDRRDHQKAVAEEGVQADGLA